MKMLYIIRHAKSSWHDLGLADTLRPLNKRGLRDAPQMGKRFAQKIQPDLMLTSPARRAFRTACLMAAQMGFRKENIVVDQRLYLASAANILSIIKNLSNENQSIAIFGHNPGLLNFTNQFALQPILKMPTCSMASLQFEIKNWNQIQKSALVQFQFDYPKNKINEKE